MGEDYIEREFEVPAANVRRNGKKMFDVVRGKVPSFEFRVSGSGAQTKSTANSVAGKFTEEPVA
jgi:hypothetical protein